MKKREEVIRKIRAGENFVEGLFPAGLETKVEGADVEILGGKIRFYYFVTMKLSGRSNRKMEIVVAHEGQNWAVAPDEEQLKFKHKKSELKELIWGMCSDILTDRLDKSRALTNALELDRSFFR